MKGLAMIFGVRVASVLVAIGVSAGGSRPVAAQNVVVIGKTVHTMDGAVLHDTAIVIRDGKIAAIAPEGEADWPDDYRVLRAAIVTPGLIDAHATVGLTGILNQKQDQDQLERSNAIQPELRAVDAFNIHDPLIDWVRSFGITTVHTGHAPGELVAGQTMIVKTWGNTVDEAVMVPTAAVAVTLGSWAKKGDDKSPGTRGKMVAMLRQQLIKAQEYKKKRAVEGDKQPDRDLGLDVLVRVLDRELPLLVTAHRAQDIDSALRLAREFELSILLDGGAEAYMLIDEIKQAGIPVIAHPIMARYVGELKNASFETPLKLHEAGIPVALQSGYESYVPKTRVVLFEAAIAAANGLSFEEALATITIDAARILKIDDQVGSLKVGKDGDVALYDGDPFEYTSHCVGVVIDGVVVSDKPR